MYYNLLTEIPVPTAAHFVTSDSDVLHITSTFHDHVRNAKKTISNSIIISHDSATSTPVQDVNDEVAYTYSPTRARRAVLRETKTKSDGSQPKRFVEVWRKDTLEVCMDVTQKHGAFYTDDHVASLSFSPSETLLIYIAERNFPEDEDGDPYKKFRYRPNFGEGFDGKSRPTIFIFSWNYAGEHVRAPSLTSLSIASEPALFGQAIFSPRGDAVYATGYEYTSDHRLLGIKFCFNRPSGIWELTLPSPSPSSPSLLSLTNNNKSTSNPANLKCSARKLTPSHLSCRSPRVFSHSISNPNDGKTKRKDTLVWLAHPTGGAHAATSFLYSLDITSEDRKKTTTTLVDRVFEPEPGTFPGLYPDPNLATYPTLHFPSSKSESPTPYIITHSIWGSRTTVLLISTGTGTGDANAKNGIVRDLTPEDGNCYSWKVLNTDGRSRVVCVRSTPISVNELVLGEFARTEVEVEVSWRVLNRPSIHPRLENELSGLRVSVIPVPGRYPTETVVIHSAEDKGEEEIRPCITMLHGGPHGTTTTAFNPANAALALEGYTLSLPNYTGSLGFGESAVRALLGKCGTLDVEDCIASTRYLIELGIALEGPGKQFVMGGSHGGFLTGHLIGQYPDMFSAAVTRNPVMSAGELSSTDIPDWYFSEFGEYYPLYSSPSIVESERTPPPPPPLVTPEMYARVYAASPIAYVDNVRASVLLLVGQADLRVAPTQGVGYYHALKHRARAQEGRRRRRRRRIEMLVFEGESHSLDGVEASRIGWCAARDFFKWAEMGGV